MQFAPPLRPCSPKWQPPIVQMELWGGQRSASAPVWRPLHLHLQQPDPHPDPTPFYSTHTWALVTVWWALGKVIRQKHQSSPHWSDRGYKLMFSLYLRTVKREEGLQKAGVEQRSGHSDETWILFIFLCISDNADSAVHYLYAWASQAQPPRTPQSERMPDTFEHLLLKSNIIELVGKTSMICSLLIKYRATA